MFWFFGNEACAILASPLYISPAPPALKGEVWTTGPPGKSLNLPLKFLYRHRQLEDVWRRGCGWRVTHRVPLSYSGSVNWCGHCGKQHGGFSKTKTRTTVWSRSHTSGSLSEKYTNSNSKRYMHPSVHSSITYNCQGMEAVWVSIDRCMEREYEACIYTQRNTAQPLRKWNFAICSHMDGHCA